MMTQNSELITAVARAPFDTEDGVSCNVELFGVGWGEEAATAIAQKNILLFVPGVCESAETWTVQNLARVCKDERWMLAVLELPGHGLSDGPRSLLQPSGRAGLDKLVEIVVHFARHVVNLIGEQPNGTPQPSTHVNLALSGCSLGGVLAAYASPKIAQGIHESRKRQEEQGSGASDRFKAYSGFQSIDFVGNILLSPAVGVSEQAVPPPMIVSALSCLAYVAPSAALMTPQEDPSYYNCPSTTKRNFSGQWPLGTSKLLLDITAEIVPEDVDKGDSKASPFRCPTACSFETVVIMGHKDHVAPMEKVKAFVNDINKVSDDGKPAATLVEIAKGDHGLLVPGKGKSKVVEEASRHIQEALQRFASSNEAK